MNLDEVGVLFVLLGLTALGAALLPRLLSRAPVSMPMVFLGGAFSHAASKRVALPHGGPVLGLHAHESSTTHTADHAQLDVARAAIALVTERFGAPTYARVDLVRDDAGHPCVLEVELVEPSLFLALAGSAAVDRLVEAFTAR